MDNQQTRLSEQDLSWLAGTWEADGSFSLNKCHIQKGIGYTQYQVNMQYVNTDIELAKEVMSVLRKMGVGYYQLSRIQTGFGTKLKHEIRVQGMKRGSTFLSQIIPHLRGAKKRRAELILEFAKERLSKSATVKYGEKEFAIFDRYLKEVSTTNTSNTSYEVKIESELQGNLQSEYREINRPS